jgi:hypothetical protein
LPRFIQTLPLLLFVIAASLAATNQAGAMLHAPAGCSKSPGQKSLMKHVLSAHMQHAAADLGGGQHCPITLF